MVVWLVADCGLLYYQITENYKRVVTLQNFTNTASNNTTGYSQLFVLIMDEKLRKELRAKKIREMQNHIILMNENDFENFKKEIVSKSTIKVSNNPTYEGVPIKTSQLIERGNVIVYDDVPHNWL